MKEEKALGSINPGKYEFFVKGVISKDKNGYDLKTQKGNAYSNLSIIVLDVNHNVHSVFEPIFSKESLKGIVYAINNPALTFVYENCVKNKENFDLENLIGESGTLLLGQRSYNDKIYPKIECFIKPKSNEATSLFLAPELARDLKDAGCLPISESGKSFIQELSEADGVPF